MIELTQLEVKVLKSLIKCLYAEAGFSDVDANDIAKDINTPTKSVRGALGSLVKKGVVYIESTDTYGTKSYELIYLSPSHYYLHPSWKNERVWNENEILIDLNNLKQNKIKVMSNKTTNNSTKTKSAKRGRPVVNGSKRQAVLAMRQAKRDAGIEIKRGRPKMVKPEVVVEVPAKGKKLVAKEVTKNVAVVTLEDIAK